MVALVDWLTVTPTAEQIDAVYASPKLRALQTVTPLADQLGLDVEVEPLIDEYDSGDLEYVPIEKLKADEDPRWGQIISGEGISDPEGFRSSVVLGINRIIDANPGRTVAVGCHGGVISAYLSHLLGVEQVLFFEARYTSICRVAASSAGHRSVRSMNELGHLQVSGVPLSGC